MDNDTTIVFFFFKQKTAYEIKECDWSSDVCSSDLDNKIVQLRNDNTITFPPIGTMPSRDDVDYRQHNRDRKSVV